MNLNSIASLLDNAQANQQAVDQINQTRNLTLDEAYAIQSILVSKRLIRGHKIHGVKMGFTSKEKMKQMGVNDLIWGVLTSDMQYHNNAEINLSRFIHPRIEPEIAFLLKKDIDEGYSEKTMKEYVEAVSSALEIIDSRYRNFKFSLEDVIADNCSSSAYILGEWQEVNTKIEAIAMGLYEDGIEIRQGNSNNILDNPWNSFHESVRISGIYGHKHKKGDVVLAGAATAAYHMKKGSSYEWRGESLHTIKVIAK